MPKILIVADDYTGANDTAVLMTKTGFPAFTVLDAGDARAAAIAGDVLADSVAVAAPKGVVKEWDINGEKATIGVEVVR